MSELPLSAYYDLSQVGEVAVSPDGDRVAFTTTEYDPDAEEPVASLFLAPADGSREPHRLTRLPGAGSPTWAPEGDRLAFLAGREEDTERRVGENDEDEGENGGDDEPKSQVWLFDLALGGDASQLTEFEEGVREFDWSPDGDRLVVSARDPDDAEEAYLEGRREDGAPIETERLQHKLDGVGYTDTVTTYLFVVDVEGDGEPDRLEDAYGGGALEGLGGLQPAWGAGGRIAFLSTRTDEPDDTMVADVYTIEPDGSGLERVTDQELGCAGPAWSPEGDRLAFTAGDPENWCKPSEVYVHDGEGYESLTPDLDRTVARGGTPQWTDEGTIHVAIADESRTRLLRVDTSDGGIGDDGGWERVFAAQGNDRGLAGFHADPGSDRAAVVLSHPSDGQDVYSVDVEDLDAEDEPDSLTRLSNANEELIEAYEMPTAERVEWESDGWTIDGVLYTPSGFDADEDGPAPLVVAIHGGPISYDEPVFSFEHAALTSRGYAVLRPNYRGGSSRGRKFAETLRGRWGTVEVEDIAAGVEFAVREGIADPDRVFGYGFSYGGIAQGFLVTQHPDLFTAAAPEHGIYDLRSAYGTDDSHNWMENEYGLPWEVPEEIDASSAILDAGNIETPLLITAGQEDWRCPPSQSEQLYVAAKKSAGEARLVLYPDEHHDVGTPDRAIHRLEEVLAWYRRHDPVIEEESEDIHGRLEDEESEGENGGNSED